MHTTTLQFYQKPLFPLGQVLATPGALNLLAKGKGPTPLIARHAIGDWGDMCEEDKRANHCALAHGDRVFSSYQVGGEKVWVISEADRSSTTLLLPSEY